MGKKTGTPRGDVNDVRAELGKSPISLEDIVVNGLPISEPKIEFEGNIVEIVKTEKGYEVRLTIDKNVDVFVNSDCVHSEYEDEAYKYVPVNMREFIKENVVDIDNNDNGDIKGAYADICIDGSEITLYFSKNKLDAIHARYSITDPLKDILYLVDDYSFDTGQELLLVKEKVTDMYNAMTSGLKELGCELVYSHSMLDGFWGWHDLVFKPSDFNKEQFMAASKVILNYESAFTKLAKEYKLI